MDGKKLEYKGEEALKELERLTMNADEVQEELLEEIVTRNGDTEYLSKYLRGSKDVSAFKNRVPVISYSGIQPYIKRIANGEDSSLISGHTIVEMLCSSGTSNGEPKLMPSIAEDLDRRTFLYNLVMPVVNQYIPGLDEGKAMFLNFVKAEMSTPCGLPARAVLTSYYKSKHYRGRPRNVPFLDYTSPDQTVLCEDSNQSMYCQLLAGLVFRHQVLRLGAVFASAFLRAISYLEKNWVKMCNDIRKGKLDASITDPECQLAMSSIITPPNPGLADEIEEICSGSSWKGILCRLWPKAKYIEAVVTGSMAQYIPSLEYYSDKRLPLFSPMYASTESFFGINLRPLDDPSEVSFTLLPNMCYYEFIPLGENSWSLDEEMEVPSNELVSLLQVKLGCYYELVVTTFAGLCRYRIGDVLQVTGFYNKAPQFKFICRRNVALSLDNDKTSEEDLHKSITVAKKLLEPHNAILLEYTSFADTSSVPGHYVLYWEIGHNKSKIDNSSLDEVLQECCIAVEEELDYTYRRCRSHDKAIGPLEIRLVKPGTFEALMDFYISQGGSINQYKTPRCINSKAALKLLESNVKGQFLSPRDPIWIP
ncbi:putative indole-3-acetic acid-amido synthetase GH3.9 [Chenopodium quinoa]|uniref:Indole-3-acetic acid-amido synthetase GH3.9 n=1 Tax=Chenopodium quinoa TaxID=63459 RepID=A0A803L9S4_CHEQI|nr:putative indole-3-acetic acid-amido synthetase GH3.9 [Chenopodium quinoa]